MPCVVANNTALAELSGTYVGKSFQSDNFESFVMAIQSAISELPALRAEAQARKAKILDTYSWRRSAKMLIDLMISR
jgi:hypothetical protein